MTTARRKAAHTYVGPRVRGSVFCGGTNNEATRAADKKRHKSDKRRFRLPLVVHEDGSWCYRFRSMGLSR